MRGTNYPLTQSGFVNSACKTYSPTSVSSRLCKTITTTIHETARIGKTMGRPGCTSGPSAASRKRSVQATKPATGSQPRRGEPMCSPAVSTYFALPHIEHFPGPVPSLKPVRFSPGGRTHRTVPTASGLEVHQSFKHFHPQPPVVYDNLGLHPRPPTVLLHDKQNGLINNRH